MTQEEKEILLKDLCARLPYGVICDRLGKPKKLLGVHPTKKFPLEFDNGEYMPSDYELEDIKPYFRPMSSMTDEEYAELRKMTITSPNLQTAVTLFWDHHYDDPPHWRNDWAYCSLPKVLDWLNERHFDYRGLIPKGLALEAPKDMYKN